MAKASEKSPEEKLRVVLSSELIHLWDPCEIRELPKWRGAIWSRRTHMPWVANPGSRAPVPHAIPLACVRPRPPSSTRGVARRRPRDVVRIVLDGLLISLNRPPRLIPPCRSSPLCGGRVACVVGPRYGD